MGDWLDTTPQIDASVGTVFTGARLRATLRAGNFLKTFPYMRAEPTVVTNTAFNSKYRSSSTTTGEPRVVWWLFLGAEGELVLHDIFLDGTVFSSSHSVDAKSFRTILTAGFHLQYKTHNIDLMWVTHSKEFETQAIGIDRHEYLSIGYGWSFGG